jgi:hypothetical protein
LVLTDGDRTNYTPFENSIALDNSCWYNSSHGLCEWHLLGQSWQNQVTPTIQNVKQLCKLNNLHYGVVTFLFSICQIFSFRNHFFFLKHILTEGLTAITWIIESSAEFEASKEQLFEWLLAKKNQEVLPIVLYKAIRDLVMQQLLPVVHKWGRHYRQHCEGEMHEVTTSIVESQNSATKGNHSYSVKCQMTLAHFLELH